jgi:hypothetical protein
MARWPINAYMRVMAAIAIGLDCILTGIIVKSIAISSDHVSKNVDGGLDGGFDSGFKGGFYNRFDGGFNGGLTVGFTVGSTWLCWAIDLSKAFNSSDERLLRLSAEWV